MADFQSNIVPVPDMDNIQVRNYLERQRTGEIQRTSCLAQRLDARHLQVQLHAQYNIGQSHYPTSYSANHMARSLWSPLVRETPREVPYTKIVYNNDVDTTNPASLRATPSFFETQKMGHR